MNIEQDLATAEEVLKPFTIQATRPEPDRLDVYLDRSNLLKATQALVDAKWGYLSAISGLDVPAPAAAEGEPAKENALQALYHYCHGAAITTLRVEVPYSDPHVPSVCGIIPSATLYEREMMEMFGFVVDDTPVASRLILADDWPVGVYPLRKSFTGLDSMEQDLEEK